MEIDGLTYQRIAIYKHDSWAATALYTGARRKVVCKFNRCQPFLGLPTRWLGRTLARHEAKVLHRLSGLGHIPRLAGEVVAAGTHCDNAVAHDYIPGHPLGYREYVGEQFFPILDRTLAELHNRNVAYADLNKRENIIVGDDGLPYLIDFQISLLWPERWNGRMRPLRKLFEWVMASDRYHLQKHYARSRPDLLGVSSREIVAMRPPWIRAWRIVATPIRTLRRLLLVVLRVRSGRGFSDSEYFAEEGARRDADRRRHRSKRSD